MIYYGCISNLDKCSLGEFTHNPVPFVRLNVLFSILKMSIFVESIGHILLIQLRPMERIDRMLSNYTPRWCSHTARWKVGH